MAECLGVIIRIMRFIASIIVLVVLIIFLYIFLGGDGMPVIPEFPNFNKTINQ